MAAPRPAPNYHSCIASAVLGGYSGMIVVCLDAASADVSESELTLYRHHGVFVSTMPAKMAEEQKARSPKLRALFTAWRSFLVAAGQSGTSTIVEDDVTFARGWFVTAAPRGAEVLLGYCRDALEPHDGPWVERHATWDATLCVTLGQLAAANAATALKAELDRPEPLPADNCLSQHWRDTNTRRITLNPSIVQHLGDVALVNPRDGIRRAPSWTGSAFR
jgi:hypothetical protein